MHRLHARLRSLYLAWFAKPAEWRVLFQHIRRHRPCRLLEIGIGPGQRACRAIEVATTASPNAQVQYAGVDLFEMRSPDDGPGLSLKLAHRLLTATKARVRLVPGDPWTALARSANSLGAHDLVLIAADQNRAALDKAWFYVPRLLAPGATVFLETQHEGATRWQIVPPDDIHRRAAKATPRRAA